MSKTSTTTPSSSISKEENISHEIHNSSLLESIHSIQSHRTTTTTEDNSETEKEENEKEKEKKEIHEIEEITSKKQKQQKEYPLIYFNSYEKNKFQKFPKNIVKTTKYHWWSFLPVYLFNQFKYFINLFFLIVAILSCIPQIKAASPVASIVPLCIMLTFSTVRELIDEIRKYIADKKLNTISYTKLQSDGTTKEIKAKEIYNGDLLVLKNNSRVPVDGIPLYSTNDDGVVFIETAELDGETNLKQKLVPSHFGDKEKTYSCTLHEENTFLTTEPTPHFDSFVGTFTIHNEKWSVNESHFIPNGCTIRNTEETLLFVVYCGKDTKLSRNSSKPKIKFSHTNHLFNKFVSIALIFDFTVIIVSTIFYYLFVSSDAQLIEENSVGKWYLPQVSNKTKETVLHFFAFLNMYSFLVPVSCLVSLEFSKFFQMLFMIADQDLCIYTKNTIGEVEKKHCMPWTSALNDELGLVQYVLSDKTGTLTENEMKFVYCAINNIIIEEQGNGSMKSLLEQYNAFSLDEDQSKKQKKKDKKKEKKKDKKDKKKKKEEITEEILEQIKQYLLCLSVCHEGVPTYQQDHPFQSSSPDEVALLEEASLNGYQFTKRTQKSMEITINEKQYQIKIQAVFPFDSYRKRMAILVRLWNGKLVLYIKGSDMTTLPLIKGWNVVEEYIKQLEIKEEEYRELSLVLEEEKEHSNKKKRIHQYEQQLQEKENEIKEVLHQLEQEKIKQAQNNVDFFAKQGYRTLVFGYKYIEEEYFHDWMNRYDEAKSLVIGREEEMKKVIEEIENDFELLGVSAVEDKLQIGVPETIESLRRAGIKVWMITGDKVETAINIGRTCRMIQNEQLYVLNQHNYKQFIYMKTYPKEYSICFDHTTYLEIGEIAEFWHMILKAKSVICCRMTPKIKGEIMKRVKEQTGKICLGIGDGGNDIQLIKESHVGIGIFGKEGTQAAQTSDYAIRKFRHLQKMIFYHGRQALRRNTMISKVSFYKNVAFIMMQFWFGLQNNFSGSSLYEDMIITLFNMVMTSMPPIFIGAFEIDIPYYGARDYPEVHKETIEGREFLSIKSYVSYIILALYQSIVLSVLNNTILMKSDIINSDGLIGGYGYLSIMTTITSVITILITMGLTIKSWNIFIILGWLLSLFLGFFCIVLVSFVPSMSKQGFATNSFLWIFSSPLSYFHILLSVFIAIAPKLLLNICSRIAKPKKYHIVQELLTTSSNDLYGKDRPQYIEGTPEANSYYSSLSTPKEINALEEYYYEIELYQH